MQIVVRSPSLSVHLFISVCLSVCNLILSLVSCAHSTVGSGNERSRTRKYLCIFGALCLSVSLYLYTYLSISYTCHVAVAVDAVLHLTATIMLPSSGWPSWVGVPALLTALLLFLPSMHYACHDAH